MDARLIAGRYHVLRELGRGGMGIVYEVEHVHTGEQLALKLLHATFPLEPSALPMGARPVALDASLIARFQREARAAAKIKSEHVVRVSDAGTAPELANAPYFVMELLNGLDLERLVEQRGPLSSSAVVSILAQVARALDRAHALGIVHRDLKPENLFLHRKDDGSVIIKILDFGISRFAAEAGDAQGLFVTSDGTLLGTPFYMAPEQARGRVHETGPTADIWAMGIITLRLLTGRAYWSAGTLAELMVQILSDPMPPPSVRFPELGARLDGWFARSCDRDPSRRFQSAGEQARELSRALGVSTADEQLTRSLVLLMNNELQRAEPAPPTDELSRTATFHGEAAASAASAGRVSSAPSSLSPSTPATLAKSLEGRRGQGTRMLVWGGGVGLLGLVGLAGLWFALRGSSPPEEAATAAPAAVERDLKSPTLPAPGSPSVEPVPSASAVAAELSTSTSATAKAAPSAAPALSEQHAALPSAEPKPAGKSAAPGSPPVVGSSAAGVPRTPSATARPAKPNPPSPVPAKKLDPLAP